VQLTFPSSDWLFPISIAIATAALALSLHTKPPKVRAETKALDVGDCSKEFWLSCNRGNLRSLDERKTEHVEVLYTRYRGFGKNHRLSRDDIGGMFSQMIGVVRDSVEAFGETYDFYALQSRLKDVINRSHSDVMGAAKRDLKREIQSNRLWGQRNWIRNGNFIAVVALIALAVSFFLGSDARVVSIRDSLILTAFAVVIVLFLLTLWICFEIDQFEREVAT